MMTPRIDVCAEGTLALLTAFVIAAGAGMPSCPITRRDNLGRAFFGNERGVDRDEVVGAARLEGIMNRAFSDRPPPARRVAAGRLMPSVAPSAGTAPPPTAVASIAAGAVPPNVPAFGAVTPPMSLCTRRSLKFYARCVFH